MIYFVEITKFDPYSTNKMEFSSSSEALNFFEQLELKESVIYIAAIEENVDYGNFYLFINTFGQAHVMLHEHREHYASEIGQEDNKRSSVTFKDEGNEDFTVESKYVISKEKAFSALKYWLPKQNKLKELIWN